MIDVGKEGLNFLLFPAFFCFKKNSGIRFFSGRCLRALEARDLRILHLNILAKHFPDGRSNMCSMGCRTLPLNHQLFLPYPLTFLKASNSSLCGFNSSRSVGKSLQMFTSWWLNQPLRKILVKLDHFPK